MLCPSKNVRAVASPPLSQSIDTTVFCLLSKKKTSAAEGMFLDVMDISSVVVWKRLTSLS